MSDFCAEFRELRDHGVHTLAERLLDDSCTTTTSSNDRLRRCRYDRRRFHGNGRSDLRLVLASLGTAHSSLRRRRGRLRFVFRSLRTSTPICRLCRYGVQQRGDRVCRVCFSSCHVFVFPSANVFQVAIGDPCHQGQRSSSPVRAKVPHGSIKVKAKKSRCIDSFPLRPHCHEPHSVVLPEPTRTVVTFSSLDARVEQMMLVEDKCSPFGYSVCRMTVRCGD